MQRPTNRSVFPLVGASEGALVRIVALRAGRGLRRRLTALGLNIGTEVRVVQREGGGLLLARGEARLAIGGGMAVKILVVPAHDTGRPTGSMQWDHGRRRIQR